MHIYTDTELQEIDDNDTADTLRTHGTHIGRAFTTHTLVASTQ